MNFKKIAIITSLLSGAAFMSANAQADASADVTLQGIITNTTCDVTVNGGKSVLNVGVFKSSEFTANKMQGAVDMPVTLTNCTGEETGNLIVTGINSVKNNEQNLFVSNDADSVGFMVAEANGTDIVKNGQGPVVEVAEDATGASYVFKVGMASTDASPKAGSYSAPIMVAYIVE